MKHFLFHGHWQLSQLVSIAKYCCNNCHCRKLWPSVNIRQHCRLSICFHFCWAWQTLNQNQIQITIWWWDKRACLVLCFPLRVILVLLTNMSYIGAWRKPIGHGWDFFHNSKSIILKIVFLFFGWKLIWSATKIF